MRRYLTLIASTVCLSFAAAAMSQQPPPTPPTAQPPLRVEAKKEIVVNWTLGDQVWSFRDVSATYEPVKGYIEPRGNQGNLAVWKLRLVKDLETGAARLHEETLGSPFKIVLLDAERSIINPDVPAQISRLSSSKMDDTIELLVGIDAEELKTAKAIRVQRRTNVGF